MTNNRINSHLATAFAAAALLCMATACDHSFREKLGSKEGTEHFYTEKSGVQTPKRVDIVPTVADENYTADMASYDFRLYALRTANFGNGSEPNYADDNDRLASCFGHTARIDSKKKVFAFADKSKHEFAATRPDSRYLFTAAAFDGMAAEDPAVEPTALRRNVTLTGTEDIVVGYAYHTQKALDDFLVANRSQASKASYRVLAEYGLDALYSDASAMVGIQPHMHLQRMLQTFDININARFNSATPGDSLFRNVIITGIELKTPQNGVVTIANDAWHNAEAFNSAVANDEVFTPTSAPAYMNVKLAARPAMTAKQQADFNFYVNAIAASTGLTLTATDTQGWYHVNNPSATVNAAKNVRVARSDSYELRINYYYVNRIVGEGHKFTTALDATTPVVDLNGAGKGAAVYTIMPPDGSRFAPGKKFTINVDIYGLENIKVAVKP